MNGNAGSNFLSAGDLKFLVFNNFGYKDAEGNIISSVHDFTATETGHCGVFGLNGVKLVINDSIFKDNSATADNGGVIIANNSDIYITNSDFVNNSSAGYGGALAILFNSPLTVLNSNFSGNSALIGGVIFSLSEQSRIFGSTFTSNTAETSGAIGVAAGWVNGSTFTGNVATGSSDTSAYGGAIHSDGKLFVSDSIFSQNKSTYGGAISSGQYLVVSGSSFDGNTAGVRGSAISANGKAVIYNSVFENNVNLYDGGTIGHTGTFSMALVGSVFNNNTAGFGGGVFSSGAGTNNSVYYLQNNTFTGNTATESRPVQLWLRLLYSSMAAPLTETPQK